MLLIPNAVFTGYVAHLNTRGIDAAIHAEYKKWLRYYLYEREVVGCQEPQGGMGLFQLFQVIVFHRLCDDLDRLCISLL
ncbi:hypothetical protein [Pelobacter propionicus]|nr:hypothetical protein [Pelobacter propionicus]